MKILTKESPTALFVQSSDLEAEVLSKLVFQTIPMIIKQKVWPELEGTLHLMNEQYLYKPGNSPLSSFFWHRDADTILEKIVDPDPEYHKFQQILHRPKKNCVSANYADTTDSKAIFISSTTRTPSITSSCRLNM